MQADEISVLLEKIKKDDRQAFDRLFRSFYPRLVKFAIQFLGERQDAEDAVAVFFIRLWQKRNTLPTVDYPETYFYTAIKNICLNYKRDHKLRTLLYQTDGVTNNQGPATFHQPDESRELKLLLEKAIDGLPTQRRLIFILVKEEGLKCREVADILNLSVRTVESQLYKAVKTLAGAISHHLGYNPQGTKGRGNSGMIHLFF